MTMRAPRTPMRWKMLLAAPIAFLALRVPAQDDVPMRAMKDELARSMSQLRLERMEKPYFIAYRMNDVEAAAVSATLGSLTASQPARARVVAVELRVGDYALDNSNFLSSRGFGDGQLMGFGEAPLDDDYQQIRRQLWLVTDAQYKRALEDLSAKRAVLRMRKRADDLPDFAREAPVTVTEPPGASRVDVRELEALARELSSVFRSAPEIRRSSVRLESRQVYTRYVNSEGTTFTRSSPSFRLQIDAETQAPDGLPIADSIELRGRTPSDLPARPALLARAREMAARLLDLRSAPSLERYNGPVLFEGPAAAEIFGQVFAPWLVATRQPVSDDPRFDALYDQMMAQASGASFLDKIGGRVLPEFLGVTDSPLQRDFAGTPLLGGQRIDDDGVPTRETRLVDHGFLKTMLATRVPVRGIPHGTGSSRGFGPAPGNLLVTCDRPLDDAALRRELLEQARKRGLDHAIIVRRVGAAGTSSLLRTFSRMMGQGEVASPSLPEVYAVYLDGREERLRGMQLGAVSPAAFRDIVAAGGRPTVFSDEFAGHLAWLLSLGPAARSAAAVVSSVVPSLLFEELSLTKSRGPLPSPPITPSPLAGR